MVFVDNQTYPVETVKARFDEYYNEAYEVLEKKVEAHIGSTAIKWPAQVDGFKWQTLQDVLNDLKATKEQKLEALLSHATENGILGRLANKLMDDSVAPLNLAVSIYYITFHAHIPHFFYYVRMKSPMKQRHASERKVHLCMRALWQL